MAGASRRASGQPAVRGMGLEPAVHRAGHRHRGGQDAAVGNLGEAARAKGVERGGGGGGPARVEEAHAARARGVDEPEGVAAHARHVRVHDGEHRARGDGGVHRGAAGAQRVPAGFRRRARGGTSPSRVRARVSGLSVSTLSLEPRLAPRVSRELERALHPDLGAAVAVVVRHLDEPVGAVEVHRGLEPALAVEPQPRGSRARAPPRGRRPSAGGRAPCPDARGGSTCA